METHQISRIACAGGDSRVAGVYWNLGVFAGALSAQGEHCWYWFQPQHWTPPSLSMPQLCWAPALIRTKLPSGGEAWS